MIHAAIISLFCVAYVMTATPTHDPMFSTVTHHQHTGSHHHHTGGHHHHTGTHHHHTGHHGHHTGPTKEPAEHEGMRFAYEPNSHKMILIKAHHCYVFTLSASERVGVHTDDGIATIEVKLLNLLRSTTFTEVTKDMMDKHVAHQCGSRATNYYIAPVV